MGSNVDRRLAYLLDESECLRECLVLPDRNDRLALLRRIEKGEVVSPVKGLFVRASVWRALAADSRALWIARALARKHPDWVFGSFTAAALLGMSVAAHHLGRIHLAVPEADHAKSTNLVVRHPRKRLRVIREDGVLVTEPFDTVVDCLLEANFADGLAIADSFLRGSRLSRDEFVARVVEDTRYRHGRGSAIVTAKYADGLSESGGESFARAVMIEEGFVIPELQVEIDNPFGFGRGYRVDFLWRLEGGEQIAGEFDGMVKLEDESMLKNGSILRTLREERKRESLITAYGIKVARFTYDDARRRYPLIRLLRRFGIPRLDDSRMGTRDSKAASRRSARDSI